MFEKGKANETSRAAIPAGIAWLACLMRLGIPRKCGRDLLCEAGDAPGPSQEVSCSATIKSKANSAAASATVSITGWPQLVQIALEAGAPRAEFKRNPSSRDHRGDT